MKWGGELLWPVLNFCWIQRPPLYIVYDLWVMANRSDYTCSAKPYENFGASLPKKVVAPTAVMQSSSSQEIFQERGGIRFAK